MQAEDAELDDFRKGVHCAALLEAWPQPWRLDHRESTRNALKYRRGKGEILIVNHDGRGWWDPQSAAKGDVFDLVQYLDPNLNFGQVRRELRRVVGVVPAFPPAPSHSRDIGPDTPVALRWCRRPRLRRGSPARSYLTHTRRLPKHVLDAAAAADVLREGPYGSAWFAHRGDGGAVTHVEIRGPGFKGSLRGGTKTLFRLPGAASACRRLVIFEAPIDALSLAAIESIRADTLYVATGGGMGPTTVQAIDQLLSRLAPLPGACVAGASDANPAGERYAARHAELAAAAGIPFVRLRPPVGTDWNDVLQIAGEVGK
ncbi:MAG TPA: DUF3991 and TOPRIM domain-containing protein [Stellaceae bacterium]|nr:DUF3991 and TOPRIM domain-containing protein [Stellaceae bacterium]